MSPFVPCESDYDIDPHLIRFMQISSFYAELSRHVKKVVTKTIPTMAISFDPKTDDLILGVNPDFMKDLTNSETFGGIRHEYDHIVYGHLSGRRKKPHVLWNVATDLAINSLIVHGNKSAKREMQVLPACALIPGQLPVAPGDKAASKEQQTASPLGELIATFPPMMASEWYFTRLMEAYAEGKLTNKGSGTGGSGQGSKSAGEPSDSDEGDLDDFQGIDSFDDHSFWDTVPEDMKEYVEGKIKSIIEKAVREADTSANGWGDMPAEIREAIRRSVSSRINWRSVLRQFIGTIVRGHRTTSIKRINRRYPYIHPGSKRGWTAKLLIAIDQSGSVDDNMLQMFFSELNVLTRKVDVSILPFDSHCSTSDVFEWKKGTLPKLERVKCGGTDFNAPTRVFNDPKNVGWWDGLLIMTDGCAPQPIPSRGKRGWILGEKCRLMFPSSELQIFVSDNSQMTGAWR